MNPVIAAALIGLGGGLAGLVVALIVARITSGTTYAAIATGSADIRSQIEAASRNVREQIEADRGNRIWEKQAAAYTDAIAGVRHRQKVRGCQIVGTRIGTEPERPKVPVDWIDVEARLIAYSSPAVLAALREAARGGQRFEDLIVIWKDDTEQARAAQELVSGGVIPPEWPKHRASRDELDTARKEADALDDALIAEIRAELHGGTAVEQFPPGPAGAAENIRDQTHAELAGQAGVEQA